MLKLYTTYGIQSRGKFSLLCRNFLPCPQCSQKTPGTRYLMNFQKGPLLVEGLEQINKEGKSENFF